MLNEKQCSYCKTTKSLDSFNRWGRSKDGLQPWCRECQKTERKEKAAEYKNRKAVYYQTNKERLDARNKQWAKEHPEGRKAIYTKSRRKNVVKVREQNLASWRKNYENNKLNIYENVRQRRARKKNAPGHVTSDEWAQKQVEYDFKCAYCKESKPLTQDHVIPLVHGGHHTISNIVPACRNCNSQKRTRTAEEFLALIS